MLKIKNILLVSLSVFLLSSCIATAQVSVTGANNYYGATYATNNYARTSLEKYPELCPLLNKTMIPGDIGNEVKRLQVVLGQEGIAYLGATGYYGPVTKNAVKVFQLRNGINQTGNVGPQTLARMRLLWCGGQSGSVGNVPGGYINNTNNNLYNTNSNGPLEVSIAPITSSDTNLMLGWNSKYASACDINGERVQPNGQRVYNITYETTFTINCYGYNNARVSKSIVLRPNQSLSNLPSINLSINPVSALVNTYATLFWTSTNTYSCTLNGQSVSVSGSQQILVTNAQNAYQLSCASANGQSVSTTVYANPGASNNANISSANISSNINSISSGQSVTLTWTSNNTSSCSVTGGANTFSGINGTQVVYPTQTTVYTIYCYGLTSGPQVTNQVIINVIGSTNTIPTVTVTANPTSITTSGQAVTLTWSSTNATYCNVLNPSGTNLISNQSISGTYTVYPTTSGNYQVTCYNGSGQSGTNYSYINLAGTGSGTGNITLSSTTINVTGVQNISWNISTTTNPQGIILGLYDSNNNFYGHIIRINNYVTNSSYSWTIPKVVFDTNNDGISCITVDNQQFCGGSPKQVLAGTYKIRATLFTPSNACFGFCQPVSGQQILGTYESQNFTINTTTSSGNITTNLTANPNNVTSGQAVVLTWSSTNATYCNILNSAGVNVISNQSTSGTYTVYPTVSGNYQVTCYNGSGQSSNAYSYVTVNGGSTGNVTSTISATPNPVTPGSAVTLTWSSTNANYCNINGGTTNLSNQPSAGSSVVYPSISTNYQIVCYNYNGQNGANFVLVTTSNNTSVTPTANIYASAQNISSGQSLTLNWYSTNANTCSLYGNNNLLISNQNTSGTYLVYPTQTTNYQITCTNNSSGQTANNYVTVTVNGSTGGNNISVVSNYNRQVVVQVTNNSCSANNYIMWGDGQSTIIPTQCGSVTLTHQYSYSGSFNLNLWANGVSGNYLQINVQ